MNWTEAEALAEYLYGRDLTADTWEFLETLMTESRLDTYLDADDLGSKEGWVDDMKHLLEDGGSE